MDKTKVSRAVSSLDRRGWVTRMRAPADRRFENLALTEDGNNVFAALMPKVKAAEDELLGQLEPAERRALATALDGLDRVCGHARLDGRGVSGLKASRSE